LHNSFDPRNATVVEAETSDKIIADKVVYRLPLSPDRPNHELVLVLVPYPGKYIAKTVFLNEKKDNHTTLDLRRYSKP
jgi:hypothetical protein